MKCPIDETELVMTDRQGIEIDYCPKCRGVWLDRGELDKIIDRMAPPAAAAPAPPPREKERYERREGRHYDDRYYEGGHRYPKKRKSLLGELFDF